MILIAAGCKDDVGTTADIEIDPNNTPTMV